MKIIRDRPRSVDIDAVLARPLFAHLATVAPEGPRLSPVWFLWEDGAVWIIGSQRDNTFPARVARDGRCAVAIVDFDVAAGTVHHVGMRGSACVVPFEAERARRLLARYLGPASDSWPRRFADTLHDPDNVFVRFRPDTAVARDQSYDPTQPGRDEPVDAGGSGDARQ